MTSAVALEWMRSMLWTAITAGAPVIGTVAIVGLLMAILQAATQVNDAAVPFVAKALGAFVALSILGGFMVSEMTAFATSALGAIADLVH